METALPVTLETLVAGGRCDLPFLVALLTVKPAAVMRLDKGTLSPGADADITIFDPEAAWVVEPEGLESRSSNSPWLNATLRGRARTTIVGGRVVWDGEKIADDVAGF